MAAAAPARAPTRRQAPSRGRAVAPARKPAPRRTRTAPKRRRSVHIPTPPGGHLIPLAVGRTAVAVGHLPDSGLVVRMTRGRAWIAVLGLLLAGIVALNVATLGLSATSGRIDQQIQTLDQENSVLSTRLAQRLSTARVRYEASSLGLVVPPAADVNYRNAGEVAVAEAARRLAGSG